MFLCVRFWTALRWCHQHLNKCHKMSQNVTHCNIFKCKPSWAMSNWSIWFVWATLPLFSILISSVDAFDPINFTIISSFVPLNITVKHMFFQPSQNNRIFTYLNHLASVCVVSLYFTPLKKFTLFGVSELLKILKVSLIFIVLLSISS